MCGDLALAPRATQVQPNDQAANRDRCDHDCSDHLAASMLTASCLIDEATTRFRRLLARLRFGSGRHLSRDLLDDLNKFIGPISMMPSESHQFASSFEYRIAIVGSATDGDATAPSELHQSLISKGSQRPQNSVVVHAQHCGEVSSSWEALAWFGVSLADRTANLSGHLLVEWRLIGGVDSRTHHDASKASPINSKCLGFRTPSGDSRRIGIGSGVPPFAIGIGWDT